MKEIIALISTDWHITEDSIEQITLLVEEKIKLAKKFQLKEIFVLGDIFNSRKAQSLICLEGFTKILDLCETNGVRIIAIPGNHDKTNYESKSSFLIPYKRHPNLHLIEDIQTYNVGNYRFILLPFFNENILIEKLIKFEIQKDDVLLTHTAFQGSINNDGTEVTNQIKPSLFKKFKIVLSGHYHNYQFIKPNIHHIPSIAQNNYGENEEKGFCLLNKDLNFEIIKSSFKRYEKVIINLDEVSSEEILKKAIKASSEEKYTRFEFIGSRERLSHIDTQALANLGIDVKKKSETIVTNELLDIEDFDVSDIRSEFINFLKEKELSEEKGLSYFDSWIK